MDVNNQTYDCCLVLVYDFVFIMQISYFEFFRESAVWVTRDAQWARDEEVSSCRLCEKEFNLSRRKVRNL